MKDFFDLILEASLSGSVIILLVLMLRLALNKAPRRYICLLWLLAAVRLLLPIHIESPLSLQPEVPSMEIVQPQTPDPVPDRIPDVDPTVPADPGNLPGDVVVNPGEPGDVVVNPGVPGDVVVTPTPPETPTTSPERPGVVVTPGDSTVTVTPGEDPGIQVEQGIDWTGLIPWIWILGASAMGVYTLVSYGMLKHRVREAVALGQDVYEAPGIDSPFLLGYLRPRIYLPVGLAPQDLDFILAHERTHLSRGDHWSKLAGFVCLSVHWFNPLVWVGYDALCTDIEMACDEFVVKSMAAGERKAYALALVNCAAAHRTIAACPVAFGEVSVKERILKVLNYRKPSFWISLVCIVAIIFTAVCLMTDPVEVDPIQRCMDAMERLIAQENYVLLVDTVSYSGDGFPVDRTRLHVQHGDDWYFRSADTDYTVEYMGVDGKLYCNKALITQPDETVPFLEWGEVNDGEVTDIDMDYLQDITGNWIWEQDWAAQEYTLVESADDRIVLSHSLEEMELTLHFTTTFIFEAGTDNLTAIEETIDDPEGSVSRVYHFLTTGESDAGDILNSYAAAAGITPGIQANTAALEQIQQELYQADYPNLLSAEIENGILYVQAFIGGYDVDMEQALLRLQMQYGSAIQVEAINRDELHFPGQPPLFLQDRYIQRCTEALKRWQNVENYYGGITTRSEIGDESSFFQNLYWKLGDDYVTMHYTPEADRTALDQSFLYKDGKLYQGWSLTDPAAYPTGFSENMFMGWKQVETIDGAIHAANPEQNWPMSNENGCYEYRSYTFLEKTEDGSNYLITLEAEGIYRPYVGGPEYEKTFLLTFTFDSGNQLVSVSQEATDLPLTFNGREEVTVDRLILTASLSFGDDSDDYSNRVINGAYEMATFDGAAWLRQLKVQDISSITFEEEALTATYTESDHAEMAQAISLLNGFTGEIRENNCWFGDMSFADHILVTMKDGSTHGIILHDGHVSIDGICYDVRQEWLDAWPTRSQLQQDMVQWCIVSMNAVHDQQKIYLYTWHQAALSRRRTLLIQVSNNWMIQEAGTDTASIWLNYNGQQFYSNQPINRLDSYWEQKDFDRTFSLPWPLDGSLKAEDWEYVESFTESIETGIRGETSTVMAVTLRQKSDGTQLRMEFADKRHLTEYTVTEPSKLVTYAVLSDPDGITPEEHLRAAYQAAVAYSVAMPDYKGQELTQEELDYFNELFQWYPQDPDGYRYNYVLASHFTTAEDCNMRYFFYDGLGYEKEEPITDAEMQFLHDNGYEFWFAGETHRLPADRVEQLLMDYFGLTMDQAWVTLPYNPNTDCYYIFHTDAVGGLTPSFSKGYYNPETGITTLYSSSRIITLKNQPENEDVPYRIISHLGAPERDFPHNSISAAKQWQDTNTYRLQSISDYRDSADQPLRQVVCWYMNFNFHRFQSVYTYDYSTNLSEQVYTIRNDNDQYRLRFVPRIISGDTEEFGWNQVAADLTHEDWFFSVNWDKIPLSYVETQDYGDARYIHYYRISASEVVGFRHFKSTGKLDAIIRTQAITENGETVYLTTTYTMETQNGTKIGGEIQEIYNTAYTYVHDPDAYFRELFTRKTDGAYAEAWIGDLYNTFYDDPAEFLTRLAGSGLSSAEQAELINHMSVWADAYGLDYLHQTLTTLQGDTTRSAQARQLAKHFLESLERLNSRITYSVRDGREVIGINQLTGETQVYFTADSILDTEATGDTLYFLAEMGDMLGLYRLTAATGQVDLLHEEAMPDVPRSWFRLYLPESSTDTVRWETINPAFWQKYLAEQENPDSILFQSGVSNATPDYVEENPFSEGVKLAFFAVQTEINLRPRMWCEYDLSTGGFTRLYGIYDKCIYGTGTHDDSEHFAPYQEI